MLSQAVRRAAQLCTGGAAIIDRKSYSWREFADRIARFAALLTSRGVQAGDRVAILARNSSDFMEAQFAIWWAGAVAVPLNTRWSLDENAYALDDCGVSLLIADDAHIALAEQLQRRSDNLLLLHVDHAADTASGHEAELQKTDAIAACDLADDALAAIYYTGGTTGAPKGVMLSPRALWASALAMALDLGFSREVRYLHAAPMFHLANGSLSLATTLVGGTHIFVPGFAPAPVIDAIEDRRATHMLLVPTMIRMLIDDPAFAERDLSSLSLLVYGAAPMPEALLAEATARLPGCRFAQAYGQTELGPLATICGPEHQVPGSAKSRSVGRAGYCVELRVCDEEGRERPRGAAGEIWVRGPNVMLGYWNKPEATAAALRDSWVRTGDVGILDDEGFVTLCDRVKDMIISGGENIFSVEVENAVCSHPAVAAAAVVGLPDPLYGERVHAVIVPRPGQAPTLDEIAGHCRQSIAGYKCPRSIELREALPLSGAGKVLKRALRDSAAS
jgi:acyl-CoA synthetase (AMP-forming)/AMP-acid ligase II